MRRRPEQAWWQATRNPRNAFFMAAFPVAATVLYALTGPWWIAAVWGLIAASYVASGMAMLRWGSPDASSWRYQTRWFPFWPPDEDPR